MMVMVEMVEMCSLHSVVFLPWHRSAAAALLARVLAGSGWLQRASGLSVAPVLQLLTRA